MSREITSIACGRLLPICPKKRSAAFAVVAFGAPDDLAADVVGDQREVAVLPPQADFIDGAFILHLRQ